MRQHVPDQRFDFRGGLNLAHSEDTVDATEYVSGLNMRMSEEYGGLMKRNPTQRIHTNRLGPSGSPYTTGYLATAYGAGAGTLGVVGLHQWTEPGGELQVVAIVGGNFYHKKASQSAFTEVSKTLSQTIPARFAEHRQGSTIVLYIAQGSSVYKWDGTTLTTTITGAPNALDLFLYKGRLFAIDDTKRLYFTAVTAPETWGDFADLETFDTDPIIALQGVGSSLALMKEDTIARFTGNDQNTIEIDKETEGISPQVGCIAKLTAISVDQFVFFLSDRGPYLATEAGVMYVGEKLEGDARDVWDWDRIDEAAAVFHRGRKEILLGVPTLDGEEGLRRFYAFSLVTNTWNGPFTFPYGIRTLARYEDETGRESVMGGGVDGWIRDLDVDNAAFDAEDDIVYGGGGGSSIPGDLMPAPLIFGAPGVVKSFLDDQILSCDLGASGSLYIDWENEHGDTGTLGPIASKGAGVFQYTFRSKAKGARLRLTFREETGARWRFFGMSLTASLGQEAA